MSLGELLLAEVVREAKVFARVRNSGAFGEVDVSGEVGDGREKAGLDGERLFEEVSELKD
jgi:hypothetical protein